MKDFRSQQPYDRVEVVDVDEFKEEDQLLSIKQILLRHIKKISDLSVQEYTAGYWEDKPVKIGDGVIVVKKYHPDLREAYINAIDFFYDMILPYLRKEKKEEFNARIETLREKEGEEFKNSQTKQDNQDTWVYKKQKFRRQLFQEILIFLNDTDFWSSDDDTFVDKGKPNE